MQRQKRIPSFITIAALLLSAHAAFGLSTHATFAVDALSRGPQAFSSGEYKFPAAIDADVLPTAATELWARVFWPDDLTTPRPIVFLLHGNYATCRVPQSSSDQDSSCRYTTEGICPAGSEVVLSHEGYSYLGERLASHGIIAVSINANRGINCGAGGSTDFGLIAARGRLILRHLEKWAEWNSQGNAPASLGVAPAAWAGAIDLNRVGLFGHSRGGEAARAAYNFYRDSKAIWQTRIPGVKFAGIFEIGATDGASSDFLDADDVAWNGLIPMCDGDVDDLEGRNPFERMLRKSKESIRSPKSLTLAWGTNHNFFNTAWTRNDSLGCLDHPAVFSTDHYSNTPNEAQKNIALAFAGSFFLEQTALFDPFFSLATQVTDVTRVDRDFVSTFDESISVRLEEFDQPTGLNSHNEKNLSQGIGIQHNVMSAPSQAGVTWLSASANNFLQSNWSSPGKGLQADLFSTFDFRVSRTADPLSPPTDFSIAFVLANGKLSNAVAVQNYSDIRGPANRLATFQTVRIPLQDFSVGSGNFVRGVRFTFDRTQTGAIAFANLRLTARDLGSLTIASRSLPRTFFARQNVVRAKQTARFSDHVAGVGVEQWANIVSIDLVGHAAAMGGGPTVEITVRAQGLFPVQDQLPVLVIDDHAFRISRVSDRSKLDTLIFSLTPAEFARLPDQSRAHVRYGLGSSNKIWRLGTPALR